MLQDTITAAIGLAVAVGHEPHAHQDQVHHARLHDGVREGRFDQPQCPIMTSSTELASDLAGAHLRMGQQHLRERSACCTNV